MSLSRLHLLFPGVRKLLNLSFIALHQAEVLKVLVGGVELLTTFTTQMSTFHSYLEQV